MGVNELLELERRFLEDETIPCEIERLSRQILIHEELIETNCRQVA